MKEWMLSLAVVLFAGAAVRAEGPAEGREKKPAGAPVVRTVYVPVIRSKVVDRQMAYLITELLVKEIVRTTPYRVVGSPDEADLILEATLTPRALPDLPAR